MVVGREMLYEGNGTQLHCGGRIWRMVSGGYGVDLCGGEQGGEGNR